MKKLHMKVIQRNGVDIFVTSSAVEKCVKRKDPRRLLLNDAALRTASVMNGGFVGLSGGSGNLYGLGGGARNLSGLGGAL